MTNHCARCGGLRLAVVDAEQRVRKLARAIEHGGHRERIARGELPGAKRLLARSREFLSEHQASHKEAS